MKKVVWFSDIHLGLKTSDIDRTEEIVQVSLQAVKKACEFKKAGEDVILVVGGDVFNHNDPSDYLISQFIRILNPAVMLGIETYVLVGNHDAISNPTKKSCLQFLKKLKGAYKSVKVVDDIKSKKWFDSDMGPVYLTFFPHITKAHLEGTKYKSTQDYINSKAKTIMKKVDVYHQVAFSHLNVRDLIPGSEENLLKSSEAWLPDCYIMQREGEGKIGRQVPTIIQGHIHTKQVKDNVQVVGAPLFCDFGEKEKKKYFAVIHVPETFNEKEKVEYIRTDCLKFVELEFDLTNGKLQNINPKSYKKKIKNAVVKLNFIVDGYSAQQDWEKIRADFQKYAHYVKPVNPKYLKQRVVRNQKQSVSLGPVEASKVWMKKHKPKNWKRRLSLAKDYVEKTL